MQTIYKAADYVFIVVTSLPMIMVMILYMGVVNIWRCSVWSNWGLILDVLSCSLQTILGEFEAGGQ